MQATFFFIQAGKNICNALDQLKRDAADISIIAISVSRLPNGGEPEAIPEMLHRELGHPYSQRRIQEIAQYTYRFRGDRMNQAASCFTPMRCAEGTPRYFIDRCEGLFPMSNDERIAALLKKFADRINRS